MIVLITIIWTLMHDIITKYVVTSLWYKEYFYCMCLHFMASNYYKYSSVVCAVYIVLFYEDCVVSDSGDERPTFSKRYLL